MDDAMKDALSDGDADARRVLENSPRGISMVVSPSGSVVDQLSPDGEGILYSEIDTALCVEPKQLHDVVGYYNRFDIFNLTIDRSANRPATFLDDDIVRTAQLGEVPAGDAAEIRAAPSP